MLNCDRALAACVLVGIAGPWADARAQDTYFPDGRATVTLPLRVCENGYQPSACAFVDVKLGDTPATMLIDTGAGFHVVSKATAEALKLKSGNKMFAVGMVETQQIRRYYLPDVAIGDVLIENAMAMRLPMEGLDRIYEKAHGVRTAGILGAGLFALGPVTLDFERGEITLRDSDVEFEAPKGSVVLPLQFHLGAPIVKASLDGGRPTRFMVDTGNNGTLLVHAGYAKRRQRIIDGEGHAEAGIRGVFGAANGVLATIDEMRFGDLVCSDVPALVIADSGGGLTRGELTAGNLGLGFWCRFARMTFDYRGRRLILERREDGPVTFRDTFGLELRIRRDRVVVADVLDNSPAAEAGLRMFDAIAGINGESPATVTAAIRQLHEGDAARLEIERFGADAFEVSLKRRPVLKPMRFGK